MLCAIPRAWRRPVLVPFSSCSAGQHPDGNHRNMRGQKPQNQYFIEQANGAGRDAVMVTETLR
eukprot:10478361-Lingulodinium_polyedra.AAC.1